jgi:hypothetical protein
MLINITYFLNSICKYPFLMEMQRIFLEVGSEFVNITSISLLLKITHFTCFKHDYAHVGDNCDGNIPEL